MDESDHATLALVFKNGGRKWFEFALGHNNFSPSPSCKWFFALDQQPLLVLLGSISLADETPRTGSREETGSEPAPELPVVKRGEVFFSIL